MKARASLWLLWFFLLLWAGFSCGCAFGRARVRLGDATALAPADPATPASVSTSSLPIPAGSPVEIRREVPAPPVSPGEPQALPTVETITVTPSAPTVLTSARAESGTQRPPDKRAELRAADNAARSPLLWASIAFAAIGVGFVFLHYPTPAALCGLGAVVMFGAWQVAGLPAWIWAVGLAAVAVAAGLYLGHERGERAAPLPSVPIAPGKTAPA